MDFIRTLRLLADYFSTRESRWAVIGGLALAAHGAGRLTHDVDILVPRAAQRGLIEYLEANGYETLHVSEGYSNHAGDVSDLGRVDVVYVDEDTARQVFGAARRHELFPGVALPVPAAEHLVAMKVLAASNDPSRKLQELADITALLRAAGLDADTVRATFERHGMLREWEQVRDGL